MTEKKHNYDILKMNLKHPHEAPSALPEQFPYSGYFDHRSD